MSRVTGILVLLLVLAFAGAYAASPLFAFQQLKQAAESGDRDRLEALVDFPAVREDLRGQTESKAMKLAREAGGIGHPLAMVVGRAAGALSDRAIDKLVTPDAIADLVRYGRAAHDASPPAPAAKGSAAKAPDGPKMRYAYLTPDRFRITIAPNATSVDAVALIMDRHGLFSWRVERIELAALADDKVINDLY